MILSSTSCPICSTMNDLLKPVQVTTWRAPRIFFGQQDWIRKQVIPGMNRHRIFLAEKAGDYHARNGIAKREMDIQLIEIAIAEQPRGVDAFSYVENRQESGTYPGMGPGEETRYRSLPGAVVSA